MIRRFLDILLLAAFPSLLILSGCVVVPVLEAVSKVGVTEKDRRSLLDERLKEFMDALYWSDDQQALAYVVPERMTAVRDVLRSRSKGERTVSSKITSLDFEADAKKAEARVEVKSFDPATLIVKERLDTQSWIFSLSDGWKLTDLKRGKSGL